MKFLKDPDNSVTLHHDDCAPHTGDAMGEICNHCGDSVSIGSGKFVNRVPDLNDIYTRIGNGIAFPFGNFVCEMCDNSSPSNVLC